LRKNFRKVEYLAENMTKIFGKSIPLCDEQFSSGLFQRLFISSSCKKSESGRMSIPLSVAMRMTVEKSESSGTRGMFKNPKAFFGRIKRSEPPCLKTDAAPRTRYILSLSSFCPSANGQSLVSTVNYTVNQIYSFGISLRTIHG